MSAPASEAELVAGARRLGRVEHDLHHLLALNRVSLLVRECGGDALCSRLDHLAGGGIGVLPIQAEGDPSGLIPQRNGCDLLRGHPGGVEDVYSAVEAVAEPEFLLVRRQADTVA